MNQRFSYLVTFVIALFGFLEGESAWSQPSELSQSSIEKRAKVCRDRLQNRWGPIRVSKNRLKYLRELKRRCGYAALGEDRFDLYFKTCKKYVLKLYSIEKVSRETLRRQMARCRHLAENFQSAPIRYANSQLENCKVTTCIREDSRLRCKKSGDEIDNVGVLFCRVVYAPYLCMRTIGQKIPVVRWSAGKAQGQVNCLEFVH